MASQAYRISTIKKDDLNFLKIELVSKSFGAVFPGGYIYLTTKKDDTTKTVVNEHIYFPIRNDRPKIIEIPEIKGFLHIFNMNGKEIFCEKIEDGKAFDYFG